MTFNDPATQARKGEVVDVTRIAHAAGFGPGLTRMYATREVVQRCRTNLNASLQDNLLTIVQATAKAIGTTNHMGMFETDFGVPDGSRPVNCYRVSAYCLFSGAVVISAL